MVIEGENLITTTNKLWGCWNVETNELMYAEIGRYTKAHDKQDNVVMYELDYAQKLTLSDKFRDSRTYKYGLHSGSHKKKIEKYFFMRSFFFGLNGIEHP
jgi:hypothetical protein